MDKAKENFLRETIEIWQPYSDKELTLEDAREIRENITGFFSLLKEWAEKEKVEKRMEVILRNLCNCLNSYLTPQK